MTQSFKWACMLIAVEMYVWQAHFVWINKIFKQRLTGCRQKFLYFSIIESPHVTDVQAIISLFFSRSRSLSPTLPLTDTYLYAHKKVMQMMLSHNFFSAKCSMLVFSCSTKRKTRSFHANSFLFIQIFACIYFFPYIYLFGFVLFEAFDFDHGEGQVFLI